MVIRVVVSIVAAASIAACIPKPKSPEEQCNMPVEQAGDIPLKFVNELGMALCNVELKASPPPSHCDTTPNWLQGGAQIADGASYDMKVKKDQYTLSVVSCDGEEVVYKWLNLTGPTQLVASPDGTSEGPAAPAGFAVEKVAKGKRQVLGSGGGGSSTRASSGDSTSFRVIVKSECDKSQRTAFRVKTSSGIEHTGVNSNSSVEKSGDQPASICVTPENDRNQCLGNEVELTGTMSELVIGRDCVSISTR